MNALRLARPLRLLPVALAAAACIGSAHAQTNQELKGMLDQALKTIQELQGRVQALEKGQPAGAAAADPAPDHPGMFAGGVALVAAYVLAVPWLGFFLTTAAFLALFPWVGGVRRPLLCAVLGVLGGLLLVVLFIRVAYISLPLGDGPFRAVSLALLDWLGVK